MADWTEYEREILAIFQTTGFECHRDVDLTGARGTHQVDIVVKALAGGSEHLWLVECKMHRRPISKRDVLALKAVVDDVGADHGFIICESGFQRGALGIAFNANLTLASGAEIAARFRKWQLEPNFEQSRHYWAGEVERCDDDGMGTSCSIIGVKPTTGRSIRDDILEIVITAGNLEWVIGRADALRLVKEDGNLCITLPWDIPQTKELHVDDVVLGPFWKKDGQHVEHVSGGYGVTFRTLAGAIRARGIVPDFK